MISLAGLLSALLLLVPMFQQEYVLDLTGPAPENPGQSRTGSGCGSGSSAPRQALPLEVTLVIADRTSYRLGGEIRYDVVIRNTGAADVRLPWSRSVSSAETLSATPAPLIASISLLLISRNGIGHGGAGVRLQGTAAPGSTITLRPNERARIRIRGTLSLGLSGESELDLAKPVPAHAWVLLSKAECEWHPQLRSTQAIPIVVLPRTR